jgi:transcriptional regulator with XRE-family HTH domain
MVAEMATGFGPRLAALREGKGWTQSELAKRAGQSRQNVAKWESGLHEPSWPAVVALAKALGVKPNAFMPKDE